MNHLGYVLLAGMAAMTSGFVITGDPTVLASMATTILPEFGVFGLRDRNYSTRTRRDEKIKSGKNTASGKSNKGGYNKSQHDGNEEGYLEMAYGKGKNGYKLYDAFDKRSGDKYGFQEQSTFGEGKKPIVMTKGGSGKQAKKIVDDHEGADTRVDTYYTDSDGDGGGSDDFGFFDSNYDSDGGGGGGSDNYGDGYTSYDESGGGGGGGGYSDDGDGFLGFQDDGEDSDNADGGGGEGGDDNDDGDFDY